MGASTFTTIATGPTLEAAFRAARADAQYQHGHGGYTGTIAEKGSVRLIPGGPLPDADAYQEAQRLFDTADPRIDDKWGPAGAIELTPTHAGARRWLFFGWASL